LVKTRWIEMKKKKKGIPWCLLGFPLNPEESFQDEVDNEHAAWQCYFN